MDEASTNAEFDGWSPSAYADGFNALVGPYYSRLAVDGGVEVAFAAQARHRNDMGAVHGGCLLAFADSALFMICRSALGDGQGVTVSLSGEFIGAAYPGDIIQATGEVTRAGGSLLFARGSVTAGGRPAMSFSGIIKRVRRSPERLGRVADEPEGGERL